MRSGLFIYGLARARRCFQKRPEPTVLDLKYKKTPEKLENSKGYLKCVADAKKFKFSEGSASQKTLQIIKI